MINFYLYRNNTEIYGFLREGVNMHYNIPIVERIMNGFFSNKMVKYMFYNIQIPELFDKTIVPPIFIIL